MEFKGTVGKDGVWKIEPFMHNSPEKHQEIIVRVDSDNFKQVAIGSIYDMDTEKGKANAKLIAAAPELLEALSWFVDFPKEDIKNWIKQGRPITITVSSEGFSKAESAIKKAIE
jgi:hypothetical protein